MIESGCSSHPEARSTTFRSLICMYLVSYDSAATFSSSLVPKSHNAEAYASENEPGRVKALGEV